jgi:hypothetical protein
MEHWNPCRRGFRGQGPGGRAFGMGSRSKKSGTTAQVFWILSDRSS